MLIPLPNKSLPKDILIKIPQSLLGYVTLTAHQIGAQFHEKCSKLSSFSIRKLGSRICNVEKPFLAVNNGWDEKDEFYQRVIRHSDSAMFGSEDDPTERVWLMWETPTHPFQNRDGKSPEPETYFIGPNISNEEVQEATVYFRKDVGKVLSEFVSVFPFLRETRPPWTGHFLPPRLWEKVEDDEHLSQFQDCDNWSNAVKFFHASNGDMVLLKSSGESAWAQLETNKIVSIGSEIEEFFLCYLKRGRRPFDSWNS